MHIGFALEYNLGHATHAANLKKVLESGAFPMVTPHYVDVPILDTPIGHWGKLPPVSSNWAIRASLAAYLGLKPFQRTLDAAFFHTQSTAFFASGFMRRVPSIVSLDATRVQSQSYYASASGESDRTNAFKKRLNENAYRSARHLVSWSEWAKQSLVADYGIAADKITVIPPGVDTDLWNVHPREPDPGATVNLLFVGGDFARKGGNTLISAYDTLPESVRRRTHLHIVTKSAPETLAERESQDNIRVYRDLTANSQVLRDLYARADLFVLPTRRDCLPLAVLEALASGLPVITTSVGALAEVVSDGDTGRIVPVNDAAALAQAMEDLVMDDPLRRALSIRARASAVARFDAAKNYRRLIELVISQAQ